MQATTSPGQYPLPLFCHPATPAPVVGAIEARAALRPDGCLVLAYRLWGDMARLRIPEKQEAERTDSLWEHTCFEAFVSAVGETAYREFNFSPSGQWAAYAFAAYRQLDESSARIKAPEITTRLFAGRMEMDIIIAREALPSGASFQIGLSAVIEDADTVDGSHSYWALHHPAALPDFHHRDGFTLELAASRDSV